MRWVKIAFSSLLILTSSQISAEQYGFSTGNTLHEWCNDSSEEMEQVISRSLCQGFIMGTFQMIWASSHAKGTNPGECIPSTVSDQQITDIVKSYLIKNPEERHTLGLLIVFQSLEKAFPGCLKL